MPSHPQGTWRASLTLADGSRLRYAKLALTTGAHPRRRPAAMGGNLAGVFTIRNLALKRRI